MEYKKSKWQGFVLFFAFSPASVLVFNVCGLFCNFSILKSASFYIHNDLFYRKLLKAWLFSPFWIKMRKCDEHTNNPVSVRWFQLCSFTNKAKFPYSSIYSGKKGGKGYQYCCWQAIEQNNNPVSVRWFQLRSLFRLYK